MRTSLVSSVFFSVFSVMSFFKKISILCAAVQSKKLLLRRRGEPSAGVGAKRKFPELETNHGQWFPKDFSDYSSDTFTGQTPINEATPVRYSMRACFH